MKKKIIVTVFSVLILFVLSIWFSNTALKISKISVSDENIPPEFDGFKIAQVSDLHNTEFGDGNERLLKLLKEANPDIIVITGDLIDAFKTDTELSLKFAKKAVNVAPTYFVTGNHEAGVSEYSVFKEDLKSKGVRVLENESVILEKSGQKINLIGIDDPAFLKEGNTEDVINTLLDENYTIVLAHRPELFESYVRTGADLVFTGHAHGGQFRLPFVGGIIAPGQGLFPEFDSGLYKKDNTKMIVSRGLGNSIIPFRINNRPEIVVAELKKLK